MLSDVLRGKEIIITDHDKPVVKMIPLQPKHGRPVFGSARGLIEMADDFNETPDEFKEYM